MLPQLLCQHGSFPGTAVAGIIRVAPCPAFTPLELVPKTLAGREALLRDDYDITDGHVRSFPDSADVSGGGGRPGLDLGARRCDTRRPDTDTPAFIAMPVNSQPSRIATVSDAEEVAWLLDRFQTHFDEYTPGPEVLAPRVRHHIEDGLSVFLLAAPAYCGMAQLRFREYLITGSPMCYLEELFVVADHRGEGHGRGLMEAAMLEARKRGATTMQLGTALSDTAALGLYESLGFTNLEKPDRPETQMLYYERELEPE